VTWKVGLIGFSFSSSIGLPSRPIDSPTPVTVYFLVLKSSPSLSIKSLLFSSVGLWSVYSFESFKSTLPASLILILCATPPAIPKGPPPAAPAAAASPIFL
jgi:hypothetical protein